MAIENRTNDSKLRNGVLDEQLNLFYTQAVSENAGLLYFQFETGGFNIAFDRKMTMTHVADKLGACAERLRKYQREGWPMISAPFH